jgi:hypothetical protein
MVSSRVVTFPEATALAEILTDPDWRYYVATVPARQAGQFYRRVGPAGRRRPVITRTGTIAAAPAPSGNPPLQMTNTNGARTGRK